MPKRYALLLGLALLFAGLPFYPANPVHACSCAKSDATSRLQTMDAVFTGRVVEKGGTSKFEHGLLRKYTFEVDQAWKGVSEKYRTVYSYDGGGASCGYSFVPGERYLVYSYYGNDSRLQTNLCSGNGLVTAAAGDLAMLGAGTPIVDNGTPEPEARGWPMPRMLLYAGAGVALLAIALLVILRMSRRAKS
ncbi:hypothetical protein MJA45_02600 [Paenibacillus aurantius]|uniref:Tissue inhibitor of metalloproteinase n=1 Tax=Paenibacillus aurantius TaxID=2918900 RepID=A0AA96RG56_9BACL|nr:hypothetical protein [Paenibacillus aurantius]WNQ11968.1 hypothetical protein MJA45_02600 [Paenibacillus aurantius]